MTEAPAPYITRRRVSVAEAMAALHETLKELDRIGVIVAEVNGNDAILPPQIAHEYRAMLRHRAEAETAVEHEDMPTARHHWGQGRDCASRLAAYLRSVDPDAALEELDYAAV